MWPAGVTARQGPLCPLTGAPLAPHRLSSPLLSSLQAAHWFRSLEHLTCFPNICFSFQRVNLASQGGPCFPPPAALERLPSPGGRSVSKVALGWWFSNNWAAKLQRSRTSPRLWQLRFPVGVSKEVFVRRVFLELVGFLPSALMAVHKSPHLSREGQAPSQLSMGHGAQPPAQPRGLPSTSPAPGSAGPTSLRLLEASSVHGTLGHESELPGALRGPLPAKAAGKEKGGEGVAPGPKPSSTGGHLGDLGVVTSLSLSGAARTRGTRQ